MTAMCGLRPVPEDSVYVAMGRLRGLARNGAIVHTDDIYWLEAQKGDALATALEKKSH